MKKIEWEDVWQAILASTVVSLVTLILLCLVSDKKVVRYSLSHSAASSDGVYAIEKHVEWNFNDLIKLDKSVSLSEAIRAVDSLNKTLK